MTLFERRLSKWMVQSTLALGLVALSGCAEMMHLVRLANKPPEPTMKDVEAANAAADFPRLKQICLGSGKLKVLDAACIAATDLLGEAGDIETLQSLCWRHGRGTGNEKWRQTDVACDALATLGADRAMLAVAEASCAELPATFSQVKDAIARDDNLPAEQRRQNFSTVALRFIDCESWDFVWDEMVHWGQGEGALGVQLLTDLKAHGLAVEDEFFAYLKRHRSSPLSGKNGSYVAKNYSWFLKTEGSDRSCKSYFPFVSRVPDAAFGGFNWYFRETGCKGAENLAAARLRSRNWRTRRGACRTLGVLGKRKHLRKVQAIAQSDATFEVQEVERGHRYYAIKVWPVRDVCEHAAGQIAARI